MNGQGDGSAKHNDQFAASLLTEQYFLFKIIASRSVRTALSDEPGSRDLLRRANVLKLLLKNELPYSLPGHVTYKLDKMTFGNIGSDVEMTAYLRKSQGWAAKLTLRNQWVQFSLTDFPTGSVSFLERCSWTFTG